MIKSILASTAVVLASVPAAFAGPGQAVVVVPTIYGKFACVERAKNKLAGISATSMTVDSDSVWGHYTNTSMGVWCRGQEAIILVSGDNASAIRDEIKTAF